MELWIYFGRFLFISQWLILLSALCVGLLILIVSPGWRIIGAGLVAASSLYIAFLVLTPERLAWSANLQSHKPSVNLSLPPAAIPRTLVVHGISDLRHRTGLLDDAMTLAETGLFDVLLAKSLLSGAKIIGRVDIVDAGDCLERRLSPELKIGALSFTARTGFSRCASATPVDMDLPAERLDLWTNNPPGMPAADSPGGGDLRGTMLLSLTESGKARNLAVREKRDRATGTRDGRFFYESRDPYSEISSWRTYDPDPIEFVLSALGKNQADLPESGRLEPRELEQRADALLKRANSDSASISGPKSALTYRAALALVGAPQRGTPEVERMMSLAVPHLSAGTLQLQVRVPSDCLAAHAAFDHRQLFAPLCTTANRRSCSVPIDPETYKERCLSGFRSAVWGNDDTKGRRLLLVAGNADSNVPIAIGKSSNPSTLHRVEINSWDGPFDIVIPSDRAIWSFGGATECIARVTVLGTASGIVGIDRERVVFGYRRGVEQASRNPEPMDSEVLRSMLARAPEAIVRTGFDVTGIGNMARSNSTGIPCASSKLQAEQASNAVSKARHPFDAIDDWLTRPIRVQDIVADPTDIVREISQR